jgi:hypothetical protein
VFCYIKKMIRANDTIVAIKIHIFSLQNIYCVPAVPFSLGFTRIGTDQACLEYLVSKRSHNAGG